ncbi:hypothetical protein [Bradyrhizobium sp. 21]|uniref:hypothetical protein n=1 Tax=Bradyrhizobium sp. 21 TaxID=2782666 RepID=UPI001FF863D3|nr:hypothetical protein [Bradyrhizobium sp. 21]MCK1389018.1 hypothetical protein [Bradyrhizobium sp. 21]
MSTNFVFGLLTGTSCTLVFWGIWQWISRHRAERLPAFDIRKAVTTSMTVEEKSPTSTGFVCIVGQWLVTGVLDVLFYLDADGTWRPSYIALILCWAATVLMLGLLGVTYGVRRKKTVYRADAKS